MALIPWKGNIMKALFDSIVRTIVPAIVGFALSLWASTGITVDPDFEATLAAALTTGFGALYYIGARLLEEYVAPRFGWLLGLAKRPVYGETGK